MLRRSFQGAVTYKRKALAGWSTEHAINLAVGNACTHSNSFCAQSFHVSWKDCRIRKVEFMNGTMYRVYVYGGGNVKPGLFKPETEASCSCK